MHELSIARSVIESVERLVEQGQIAGQVRKVCLKVGRLSSVVPESLQFAFEVLIRDSSIPSATLEIESTAVEGRCRACGLAFVVEQPLFACPGCGHADVHITGGQELVIQAVEVEESDGNGTPRQ
jgi:hydrogenase nickel incorporation protein HypA/HybF